ncbi:MAG: hypothetical protein V3U72_03630, partial [Candidatus Aenigmarchaeota archaeon]
TGGNDVHGEKRIAGPPLTIRVEPLRKKHLDILKGILAENFMRYNKDEKTATDFACEFLSNEFKPLYNSKIVLVNEEVTAGGNFIIPEEKPIAYISHVSEISVNGERATERLLRSLERTANKNGIKTLFCYPLTIENYDIFEGYEAETIMNRFGVDPSKVYLPSMRMKKTFSYD